MNKILEEEYMKSLKKAKICAAGFIAYFGVLMIIQLCCLLFCSCGSKKHMVKQSDTKTEAHIVEEVVRVVSIDTSKTEEKVVTITEWFYEPSEVVVAEAQEGIAEQVVPKLKYKRQVVLTKKDTENGITDFVDVNTTKIDTISSSVVNENTDIEKGTNTVKSLRNVAVIIGLILLCIIGVIVLIVVVKKAFLV